MVPDFDQYQIEAYLNLPAKVDIPNVANPAGSTKEAISFKRRQQDYETWHTADAIGARFQRRASQRERDTRARIIAARPGILRGAA